MAHSFCTYQLGNPIRTGESTLSTIMSLTNIGISGARVGVIGYGSVGQGIALTARRIGAIVYVVERNPRRKAAAYFDGMIVSSLRDLVRSSEVILTSTGHPGTITQDMFSRLRKSTYLANVGCFRSELPLAELAREATAIAEVCPGMTAYHLH